MQSNSSPFLALVCFLAALVHSLAGPGFERKSRSLKPSGALFHFLHHSADIEVVFAFYAGIYLLAHWATLGFSSTLDLLKACELTGPLLLVIVMITSSTSFVIGIASRGIESIADLIPVPQRISRYATVLILGPLLGSLITEPAAMTVTALLLHQDILAKQISRKLFYSTLALLFINVSIGGILTSFAAPPVVMVARHWSWDSTFMFTHFGWRSLFAVSLNTVIVTLLNHSELRTSQDTSPDIEVPREEHSLIAKAVWVGIFLTAIKVLTHELGSFVEPLILSLQGLGLYAGATLLTGIVDNAAITAMVAPLTDLPELAKKAVFLGAVLGGGLTLIANAPNPAGFSILKSRLGREGFSAAWLILWAFPLTLLTGVILWIH